MQTKKENSLAVVLGELGDNRKYKEQGEVFLKETRTTLEVIEAVPQKRAPFDFKDTEAGDKRINYSVTLKNPRGSYTFDFFGSQHDAKMLEMAESVVSKQQTQTPEFFAVKDYIENETGEKLHFFGVFSPVFRTLAQKVSEIITPSAYDILTCMHPMEEESFEEWCASYGYDEDSRMAEKTYNLCVEQDRHMRRMFTHEELEALNEIA